ncbi:hypothetical protein LJR030_004617 [Rhizobium sp. LjRoot30]|uniref:hypothetical protein n=1 Tax=Rhizobium sp. LjRoot30 TaxID=3342320 RepID=UPI003ECCAE08
MSEEEFQQRFVAHMLTQAGIVHFEDGTPVRYYAEEMAQIYWQDPDFETMSPEECAEDDMAGWETAEETE